MEGLQIDSRYIAHKLIQRLYEQGKINKATYDNVLAPIRRSRQCRLPRPKRKRSGTEEHPFVHFSNKNQYATMSVHQRRLIL